MINSIPPKQPHEIPTFDAPASSSQAIAEDFERYLTHTLGRYIGSADRYLYEALSYAIRDRVNAHWHRSWNRYRQPRTRKAYYLSLEFLIGRSLGNHLLNLDILEQTDEAMQRFAMALETVMDQEPDAGLGNGGLGRLAACFMDSCATLGLPVIGYGLRYEYGMFFQKIIDGQQIEEPDHWLRNPNPWELVRPEYVQAVRFGGHTEKYQDAAGVERVNWHADEEVIAVPYDVPISGYDNQIVNTLRLWKATTTDEFNLQEFNAGSYIEAVMTKTEAEHISMVLYPNDTSENGKILRLKQQYFLASASLQDVCRIWERNENSYEDFAEFNVFQMNDTHPTIAVAELMRILVDDKGLAWDKAWEITQQCMAYTNHTLLPEALECWQVSMFEQLLPRLMEIIYRINAEFLKLVAARWPDDPERQGRMSIIDGDDHKIVRMAYLAIVGSHSVNGVAELHSQLLKENLFRDFYELWPEKFNNKTNGVTPRRWMKRANPSMSQLISEKIGDQWVRDLSQISQLTQYADKAHTDFQQRWYAVKQANKQRLAALVERTCGVQFNPSALFDVQVKRFHEYKRQHLNILHVIHLYNRIKSGDTRAWVDRCVLIGGKAAPGYIRAKSMIKLINNVAEMINNDPDVGDLLKVAFFPNFNVSAMEVIAPGTDLSEQISTAGKEASGTGNMKFMMNGALTIGTLDGANIEIREAVGADNFFLFGMNAAEVAARRSDYQPQTIIDADPRLQEVMQRLESGFFNPDEPGIFDDLINSMKDSHDPWITLADFGSYVEAQEQAGQAYLDRDRWIRMSILNTAASGRFSTDRTISQYNQDIWKLTPHSA